MFASPERLLLFDLNVFDETLPGPFEYDVLRMTASFTIGTQKGKQRKAAEAIGENAQRNAAKARSRNSRQALSKLAEYVDGQYRIVSQPPIVIPARELLDDRRHLLERFQLVDVARKVVGVGSVGTRSFIALLQGRAGATQHSLYFVAGFRRAA